MTLSRTDLKAQIEDRKKKYCDELLGLNRISDELLFLKEIETNSGITFAEKRAIEEYKLSLINQFCQIVNDKAKLVDISPVVEDQHVIKEPPYFNYYGYLISGLVINLINGFLHSRALLMIIPAITTPALVIASSVMTLLNGVAYYLYEGYVLKKNLGIPILEISSSEYLSIFEKQIELTTKMNNRLFHYSFVNGIQSKEYKQLAVIAARLNESVNVNRNLFENYQESMSVYLIRQSIIGFGVIMAAGGAFFSVKSLLTLASAAVLMSPVGIALTSLCITLSVAFYLGQRRHKVYKMLNPEAGKFVELQEKFSLFKPRLTSDFTKVIVQKILSNGAPVSPAEIVSKKEVSFGSSNSAPHFHKVRPTAVTTSPASTTARPSHSPSRTA